jgi:tRNA-dihydrouridine synthase
MLKIYFAPLQGYTEDVYRRLHHQLIGGVDVYSTPFIRLEHGELRSKDLRDIRPEFNTDVPVMPQAIAKDGKELGTLVETISGFGYQHIDINMGCPFPLQAKHGRGCGILPYPEKVEELMDVVKTHSELTFSVKMRLGYESSTDWKKVLPLLNQAPLTHITLHPRVGSQQYKGTIDKNAFREFKEQCTHPVIYNGDVLTLEDIRALEAEFPDLEGVMIGRGLLARPTLAWEYKNGKQLSDVEVIQRIKLLHARLLEHYERIIPTEPQRLNKIRTFWDFMENTLGRKQWKKIEKAGNMKNYLAACNI